MAAWVFWSATALTFYTYVGYLILLVLMDALADLAANLRALSDQPAPGARPEELPTVTVLIAAYNEESCLREKLQNTLAFDYPPEKLTILVGSDGSTDATDEIVRSFGSRGVRLSAAPRAGKAQVLNRLARFAPGQVWLFTDANTLIAPDALRLMTARLRDPRIGGVCGRLRIVAPNEAVASEGLYWKYETLLKIYESRRSALIGANGGLYCIRREEWQPLPPDTVVDDFLVSMRIVACGRGFIYEPRAVAAESASADLAGEFRRHVRISAGNYQALRELRALLIRRSFAAFAFWSHKVLRWSVPLFLLLAFLSNLLLLGRGPFYVLTLGIQLAVLAAALVPQDRLPGLPGRICGLARYFVEMNAALAVGLLRYLRRAQTVTWQRTDRAAIGPLS